MFFTDRGLGKHIVPEALRAAGHRVEIHDDHFDQNTPDQLWCREVGSKGWVILTKDKQIRSNRIELEGLLAAGVPCFCLAGGNMTGAEMASAFLSAMPIMRNLIAKYAPPFVAAVSRKGDVSLLYTHNNLIEKIDRIATEQANRKKSKG